MKLTPLRVFVAALLIGAGLFAASSLLSALGEAASQRSDAGVLGLGLVGVAAAATIAALAWAAIKKRWHPRTPWLAA